jgi:regulatory protein
LTVPPAPSQKARTKKLDIHERALRLLAVRQRSRRELERRLVQAGFEADDVANELERLQAVGLLDDEAFARAVVEGKMGSRGESRRVVAGRLARAGVASDVARLALDEAPEGEQERCDRLAAARIGRLGGVAPEVAYQRLSAFLVRRGYPYGVAQAAARRAVGSEDI